METIEEKKTEIAWEDLVERAHNVALINEEEFLVPSRSGTLLFKDMKSCFECYALAEEEFYEEIGSFTLINVPTNREFNWEREYLVKKVI